MKTSVAVAMAGIAGVLITSLLGFAIIPWLRKLSFGGTVLDVGLKWHKAKQGTPTMGGLLLIIGAVTAVAVTVATDKISGGDITAQGSLVASELYTKLFSGILMALAFALSGFADDYLKSVRHLNIGLTVKEKTVAWFLIALAYLTSLYMGMKGQPYMFVPFVGVIEIGFFYWILGIAVIYAAINAVNFTDGVDGLCGSVAATTAVSIGIIAALKGLYGFSMAASALAGACIGFVLWNKHPSKVFMGETGSLFAAGMLIALAYAVNCPLILLLCGLAYAADGISYVLQIICYRVSGKRILKAAPLHRHLKLSGWSENKIVCVFTLINILGGAAAVALMHYGGYAI